MKLTRAIKDKIIENAVVKSGMKTEAEALVKERAVIAEKLRRTIVSEDHEASISKLLGNLIELTTTCELNSKRIPELTCGGINIVFNGQRLHTYYNGKHSRLRCHGLIGKIDDIYKMSPRGSVVVTDDMGLFGNDEKCTELIERCHTLETEINAILSKCTTVNKLIKMWPESKELIPAEQTVQSKELMVDTSALNNVLGLPSNK